MIEPIPALTKDSQTKEPTPPIPNIATVFVKRFFQLFSGNKKLQFSGAR